MNLLEIVKTFDLAILWLYVFICLILIYRRAKSGFRRRDTVSEPWIRKVESLSFYL